MKTLKEKTYLNLIKNRISRWNCIRNQNGLWVAHWAGGKVSRINLKTYKIDQQIKLPALNITSVTFVGKKLNHLFITSAKLETSKTQLEIYKHAGSSFIIKTGFTGLKIPYGNIKKL